MKIQVISFNCVLKNKTGRLISSTFNRDVLNAVSETQIAGTQPILDGLVKGLQQIKKGERRSIELSAQDAYGLYEPKKVILFPKKKLPKTIRVGEYLSIVGKSGQIRSYRVLQIHDDLVSLDGNHPLAGQDLVFEIEAIEARDATAAEISESCNLVCAQILH